MTDYRGLGFDPTPGHAGAVAAASERCAVAFTVPGEPPEGWTGAAADGFRTRLEAVVSELTAVRRAMRAAAEVLDGWATTLLATSGGPRSWTGGRWVCGGRSPTPPTRSTGPEPWRASPRPTARRTSGP